MPSDPRGVSVIAAPPPGYNPVTGTAFANAQLALPPAPNPAIAPDAFAAWRNAVTAAQNREPSTLNDQYLQWPNQRKMIDIGPAAGAVRPACSPVEVNGPALLDTIGQRAGGLPQPLSG
jgi:hypothetical protein